MVAKKFVKLFVPAIVCVGMAGCASAGTGVTEDNGASAPASGHICQHNTAGGCFGFALSLLDPTEDVEYATRAQVKPERPATNEQVRQVDEDLPRTFTDKEDD